MKKPMGILHKLRVFWHWITEYKYGAMECCHYCESVDIKILKSEDDGNIYRAKYMCLRCGAIGYAEELWEKGEQVTTS